MNRTMEEFIFDFIDQCKLLFFPEKWNNTFLDYSKNELFTLLYVYRKGSANMTEIADYIGVPLNTATGIVSRLEKRNMIKRERDLYDKRVVTITINEAGKEILTVQLKQLEYYYQIFISSVTEEEEALLLRLLNKFLDLVTQDMTNKDKLQDKKSIRKITIE